MKKFLTLIALTFSFFAQAQSQFVQQWTNRWSGVGDNSDKFNAIVSDNNGNYVMCGYTERTNNYKDILVVKIDTGGTVLWSATYDGSNHGDDEAIALVCDAAGNVYTACYADQGKSNDDFLTIKFSPTGDTLWIAKYNNSASNNDDHPMGIAIDNSANIYVTGWSVNTNGDEDALTISYDSSGTLIWQNTYAGSANGKDEPAAIIADTSGNSYIAGRTKNVNDDDYFIIKYDNAGSVAWFQQPLCNGSGDDRASALAFDPSGNIIVTGRSNNGSNDDYYTIKYNTSGSLQWQHAWDSPNQQHDRALAVKTDASGNVFVAGQSAQNSGTAKNYDITVVKYNSSGNFQSANPVDIAGKDDIPSAMFIDASNNIYVTGKADVGPTSTDNEIVTLKFNNSLNQQWQPFYNGPVANGSDGGNGIIADASGKVYVAGSSDETTTQKDATYIKYNSSGSAVWTKHFNGLGDFSDSGHGIYVDSAGNTYVGGYTFTNGENLNLVFQKISPLGNTLCYKTYNGTNNDDDAINDLKFDASSGKIYAAGYTKTKGVKSDFILVKFNPATCDTIWTRKFDYMGQSDKALTLAIDNSGNIYVTGTADADPIDTITNTDIITIKYNASGNILWVDTVHSPQGFDSYPVKILLDNNGNVYVAGASEYNSTKFDMLLVKYNAVTGAQQWLQTFSGPGNGDNIAADMALDSQGNIYICGSNGSSGNLDWDYAIFKYTPAGTQSWGTGFANVANDIAVAIGIDVNDNIYVTGYSDVSGGPVDYDIVTLKVNKNTGAWTTFNPFFSGYGNGGNDKPVAMIVSDSGRIFIAAESEVSFGFNKNYMTIAYDSSGALIDSIDYDSLQGTDSPNRLFLNGNVLYVTGGSHGGASQKDILTIKYDITLFVGTENVSGGNVIAIASPNPFHASSIITVVNPNVLKAGKINFELFDLTGRKAGEQKNISGNKIFVERNGLENGMYFFRLSNVSGTITSGKLTVE